MKKGRSRVISARKLYFKGIIKARLFLVLQVIEVKADRLELSKRAARP